MNAKEIKESIQICLAQQLVPFIQGSPGIGKSDIVKSIAEQRKLKLIDIRLSQCDPTDLSGLPRFNQDRAEFVPFDIFPLEDTSIPKGFKGWLVFLDEINSASRSIQAAAYKLVLDRMVGQKKLNDAVFIICAGNKETDNAVTNPISTALRSRFITLPFEIDHKQWLEWAIDNDIDFRITSYITAYGDKLSTFNPEEIDQAYACPRTWVMLDKIIKRIDEKKYKLNDYVELVRGTIGNLASEFVSYCEYMNVLPNINDILQGKRTKHVSNTGEKYMIMGYLASNADKITKEEECKNVMDYIDDFGKDFIPPFCMSAIKKNAKLPAYASFKEGMKRFALWLN